MDCMNPLGEVINIFIKNFGSYIRPIHPIKREEKDGLVCIGIDATSKKLTESGGGCVEMAI